MTRKGEKHTAETIERLRLKGKLAWERVGRLRVVSEEERRRRGASVKRAYLEGRLDSKRFLKLNEARRGMKLSDDHKKNIASGVSLAMKGRPQERKSVV